MFVATFEQVSPSSKFKADKSGQMPFIGKVIAGRATGTLINAAIFKGTPGRPYLCQNVETVYEGKKQNNVEVLMELTASEALAQIKELGAGKVVLGEAEAAAEGEGQA